MLLLKPYTSGKPKRKDFTLNSTMLLLKQFANRWTIRANLYFKFHYASIKTGLPKSAISMYVNFKFHYASIKTDIQKYIDSYTKL